MQFEGETPSVVAIVPFSGAIFLGDEMITTTFSSVSNALSLSCQCGTLPNTGVDLRRSERVDSFLNLWSPPIPSFFPFLSGADEESRGGFGSLRDLQYCFSVLSRRIQREGRNLSHPREHNVPCLRDLYVLPPSFALHAVQGQDQMTSVVAAFVRGLWAKVKALSRSRRVRVLRASPFFDRPYHVYQTRERHDVRNFSSWAEPELKWADAFGVRTRDIQRPSCVNRGPWP